MRKFMAAAALAIACASSTDANILDFRKSSQTLWASACRVPRSELLYITIGPEYDWFQTAEVLDMLLECAHQLHNTRDLSINISIPFEEAPSRIESLLEKIMEEVESGIENGFTMRHTVKFEMRPPQKTISQADFKEHGVVEYHYRQEDFNTHDPSKEDLETADDIDLRRFDFMVPFKPETAQLALREYQAGLEPTRLPTPPPVELLNALTTVLQSMTNLETLRLRIDPPEHEVIAEINQTFHNASLSLPSIKWLHLSLGLDFLTSFTPNINFITSIGVFNSTSALNLIRSTKLTPKLQHLTLRTRWDEQKLRAIVQNCPNLTTLYMLPLKGHGHVLNYRRNCPYDGGPSALLAPTRPISGSRKSSGPRGPMDVERLFEELPKLETVVVA
ncbi:hypothetical protein HII31_07901 [Pseudocercospora fuligena]|uniref:F-box domain-containing protein n=1 Tax=Pseudocercospora fuligena TaxID=685502 RepID=A0A8H6RH98_9PEZI|nr:hypothetical protein HII31_07901 [Pseudocercospora fuligena]